MRSVVGVTPFRQHPLAEEGVDEARLARVELSRHDEQEEAGELIAGVAEAAEVVGIDIAAEAAQRGGQTLEQLLLARPEVLLALREDRAPSQQSPDHAAPPQGRVDDGDRASARAGRAPAGSQRWSAGGPSPGQGRAPRPFGPERSSEDHELARPKHIITEPFDAVENAMAKPESS